MRLPCATVTCSGGTIFASNSGNNYKATFTVNPISWTGATNKLWSVAGNWSCNRIPVTGDYVEITTGNPQLDIDFNAGGSLIISGAGTLDINSNKVLSISTSADFGGRPVTVKSTDIGTGSIGQTTGTLTGATNVIVERYIGIASDADRGYRTLAPSVNTTGGSKPSIRANWQEGSNNANKTTNVIGTAGAGFGTHITGTTSDNGTDGLDPTQSGARSLYTYSITGYSPVINTISNVLDAKTGYLFFVRGDRSDISRINATASSSNTTLMATGTLLSGNVDYTLNGNDKFTLITNPYASPIGWDKINPTTSPISGLATFYTYVDPKVGSGQGAYVTVGNDGVISTPGTNATVDIQSGQAFFVKGLASSPTTLSIIESHKSTDNNNQVFRTGSQEKLGIGLYFNLNSSKRIADGVNVLFNNNYSADVDANDAEQLTNFDEDISINRNGKALSIEGRPLVDVADTIFLNMTHMKEKEYTFEFTPASFNAPGLRVYLQDKFLKSETAISLTDLTSVTFGVDAITASAASDRFRVVFRAASILPINFTNVKAFEKGNSIQVEWNLGNEQNMKQYQVEKSTDGRTFTKAGSQAARTISSSDSYQWLDVAPNMGNNFYRIKAIENSGMFKYSQVVNVKTGKNNSAISVYPNPVINRIINLQLVNQLKGKYVVKLLNQLGQEVYRKEFNHIGGSATEMLNLGTKISKGMYNLQITANGKSTVERIIFPDLSGLIFFKKSPSDFHIVSSFFFYFDRTNRQKCFM